MESDSADELSFESDDEGNYQQNLNKKHQVVSDDSGEDELDEEEAEDEEELDDEGVDDEDGDVEEVSESENEEESAYKSDDSAELSFEEDSGSDNEDAPASSSKVQKQQPAVKKEIKQNGSAKLDTKPNNVNSKTNKPKGPKSKKSEPNAVEAFKNELNKSGGSSTTKDDTEADEYEKHDTDDEEDIRNTIGNIPMQWYDEYKHIGYDWDAKKIIKPPKRDQLDDFLKRMEDPNFWRTVKDPQTGQDVILSDADIDLIKRINSRRVPDANFEDYTVCTRWIFFFMNLNDQHRIKMIKC